MPSKQISKFDNLFLQLQARVYLLLPRIMYQTSCWLYFHPGDISAINWYWIKDKCLVSSIVVAVWPLGTALSSFVLAPVYIRIVQ